MKTNTSTTVFNLAWKDIELFRNKYNDAVEMKLNEFVFKGVVVLTDYAKYILEYIDMQNDNKDRKR